MLKRKPLLFFTLIFAIVAIFAATEVMAQDLPLSCKGGNFDMTPAPGDFPRLAVGNECGGEAGWVWEYTVSAEDLKYLSAITKIFFYAPSYPPNNIRVIPNIDSTDVYERGQGAHSTTFGEGIYNGITWSIPNNSGANAPFNISFCTPSNTKGLISPAFATAKAIIGCEAAVTDDQGPLGGIMGPGPTPVLPNRDASSQTFTVSEGDQTCTIVAVQGSPPTVTAMGDCLLGGINGVKRLEEIQLDGKSLVTFPFNVWVKSHGSPGSFTYCYPNGYCVVFNF